MTSERDMTRAILKAIAQGEDRSSLFWWMVEHHDEMIAAAGSRISWVSVCAAATEHGLTDTNGRPFTTRNARETWLQARIAVAKAKAKVLAQPPKPARPTFPSRISPDWRPQIVTLPSAPPAAPAAAAPQSTLRAATSLPRFPTVDPAGNPLPQGHVFHNGKIVEQRVAEVLEQLGAEADQKDWLK